MQLEFLDAIALGLLVLIGNFWDTVSLTLGVISKNAKTKLNIGQEQVVEYMWLSMERKFPPNVNFFRIQTDFMNQHWMLWKKYQIIYLNFVYFLSI